MAKQKALLEIHKNGINANHKVRSYEIWLRDPKTHKVSVEGEFPSLDEAIYHATYNLGYYSDEIQINF